jgi:hypothetical protein
MGNVRNCYSYSIIPLSETFGQYIYTIMIVICDNL